MPIIRAKKYHNGLNTVVDQGEYPKAQMDFKVLLLNTGERTVLQENREVCLLLMHGEATLQWEGNRERIKRASCFRDAPYCLSTPSGVEIAVESHQDNTQFAYILTDNGKSFPSRLYTPEDCPNENRGEGTLNECSTRIVRSIRGRSSCPETNFFMGEVVNAPGKWSSYPPHSHPHPEIYYYKFLPNNRDGFGFSQDGYDTAHVVNENDALLALDGSIHAQVAAPGYAMYYVWVIVDSDRNPYVMPPGVDQFKWTTEPGAKFFPDLEG